MPSRETCDFKDFKKSAYHCEASARFGRLFGMTSTTTELCQRIKRLGYSQDHQIALYGEIFEVVSDPFIVGQNLVFVDARERRSGQVRRVRIPINIVEMAKRDLLAA